MVEMDFLQIAEALGRLKSQNLSVFPQQCVRLRHKNSHCNLCEQFCPSGVIHWSDGFWIAEEDCTSCGICAAVCPSGAIEAANPKNLDLQNIIQNLPKENPIVFACPRVGGSAAEGVIRVSCLGRVDASLLISAAAEGFNEIELIDCACDSCPDKLGKMAAEQAVIEAIGVFTACGYTGSVGFKYWSSLLEQKAEKSADVVWGGSVENIEKDPSGKATLPKGELPVRLPEKRQILKTGLEKFNDIPETFTSTQLWATVTISSACTGCQMCAFFCPTGALSKVKVDDKPGISFKISDCVNCRLCQDACYMGGISLGNQVDLAKVIAQDVDIIWSDIQSSSQKEKIKRLKMFNAR